MNLVETYTSVEWNDKTKTKTDGIVKTVIIAKDGIYEKSTSWLGSSLKKVNSYGIATYPEVETNLEVKKVEFEKIPAIAIAHVMEWYHQVQAKTGEEAQINFYRLSSRGANEDGSYTLTYNSKENHFGVVTEVEVTEELKDIKGIHFWGEDIFSYTPKQSNSGALTSAKDPVYDALNKEYGMYIETHSHNSMSAFRSGTDEANSWNEALQLVFGHFGTQTIEMFDWVTIRGVQEKGLKPEILEYFVDFPSYTWNESEEKLKFDSSILSTYEIDQDLIDSWNEMILPKPVARTFSYGQFGWNSRAAEKTYGASTRQSWGEFDDEFSYKFTPRSHLSAYKNSNQKVMDAIEEAFEWFISEYPDYYAEASAFRDGVISMNNLITYVKGTEEDLLKTFTYALIDLVTEE